MKFRVSKIYSSNWNDLTKKFESKALNHEIFLVDSLDFEIKSFAKTYLRLVSVQSVESIELLNDIIDLSR